MEGPKSTASLAKNDRASLRLQVLARRVSVPSGYSEAPLWGRNRPLSVGLTSERACPEDSLNGPASTRPAWTLRRTEDLVPFHRRAH